MPEQNHRYHYLLISICLVAAIIAVYWPVYKFDFVKYDDDVYVTNNVNIQSGLNFKSLHWAFISGDASNWHPVTWLSLMIDYQLFKDWAGGYHLINVLFHILNALLLFYLLRQMTNALWPSAFVAAAFALHPLHVESVAWIAERKDVLSTFFWLLTMWAYARYVESPKLKWYLTAFVLFVLGLMSKPMLVTLPFVLLLLDYWPLERKISRRLLIEKIPFFICSFISCIVTFFVQRNSGAMTDIEIYGTGTRIGNILVSYTAYIAKMIWPDRLAVLYPYPAAGLQTVKIIISALLLALISIYFIYMGKRYKFMITGWLWYLGTLVPVIGLIQVGMQSMADRYTYIPLTGLFIIIAWSAAEFVPRQRYKILVLPVIILLAASGITAFRQLGYWKNSQTLYEHTLQATENNYIIYENYIAYLNGIGRLDDVIKLSYERLKIKHNTVKIYNNLGSALLRAGRTDEAVESFKLAIKCKPDFIPAYNNLAIALCAQSKYEEAVTYFEQAIQIKPDFVDAYLNLAIAFNEMGKFNKAVELCNRVLEFEPNNIIVRQLLEAILKSQKSKVNK